MHLRGGGAGRRRARVGLALRVALVDAHAVRHAIVYVTISVAITGADASACLATPAALALALQGALGGNVSNLTVIAAGAGALSPTASASPVAKRRLDAAGPVQDARPRMLLASQGASSP